VPYSWGGGHGPRPGPTDGICQGWGRPAGAPKTLFAGPACASSVTKAHPSGYGDNGKYGLDCSGFVRWVYFLIYGQDVLGPGSTSAQQSQPALANVPAAQRRSRLPRSRPRPPGRPASPATRTEPGWVRTW